jgi:serine/threonine-protein kinase
MSLTEDAIRRIQQRVGTIIRGKYRVDGLRGIGGSAAIFEATHRNGSRVALKVLHPEFAKIPIVRSRFLREGYVANRIAHPSVTRVIDDDDDEAEGTVFLVLELLDGETIEARRLRLGGCLPLEETLGYADGLLDVLAVAHEEGIVHRDVKPANLFLTTRGDLKVLDFGIARLLDGTGATGSGQVLGTPGFMAPEQANGHVREIDARTDLFSVGALLFELLTGSPVHAARTANEQLVYAATQAARPVETLLPSLAQDVAWIVNRALAFDKEDRWPSARAMRDALRSTATMRARCLGPSAPLPAQSDASGTSSTVAPILDPNDSATTMKRAVIPGGSTDTIAFDLRERTGSSDRQDR